MLGCLMDCEMALWMVLVKVDLTECLKDCEMVPWTELEKVGLFLS